MEEEYDNLPQEVKDILDSFDIDKDAYKECDRIIDELNEIGWTADYGLSGEIYDVMKKE
jgi:hypothetical protein